MLKACVTIDDSKKTFLSKDAIMLEAGEKDSEKIAEKQVEDLIRQRWKTYNQQWMGEEKFEALVQSKVNSDLLQHRHLSYLESNIGNLSDKVILDMGCGEGGFLVAVKKMGLKAVGTDLSKTALDIAHLQMSCRPNLGNPSILTQSEGHHVPFADNTFDLITSIDTLEHIPDLEGFLKEMSRILKKGGYFYANTPNRHWPYETHCRMFFLHWVPLRFRPFLVKTFFPKRIKKIERMNYLEALNLLTPKEVDVLSVTHFGRIDDLAEVLLNRYRNDQRKQVHKTSGSKKLIITTFLAFSRIPGISSALKAIVRRYSPEIILLAQK